MRAEAYSSAAWFDTDNIVLLYFTLTFVIWLVSSGHLYWSYMVTLQYCNYTSKFWEPLGPFFFVMPVFACVICMLGVSSFSSLDLDPNDISVLVADFR
jgi:hypothetical protein